MEFTYLPREKGEPQKRRFAVLGLRQHSVEQLLEDFDRFLSKGCLVRGQSHRQAQRVLKASLEADRLNTDIPRIWDRMVKDPDDELVELISKRVYDKVSIRPSKEQVVAVLNNLPVPVSSAPDQLSAIATRAESSGSEGGAQSGTRKTRPTRKPIAIELWGDRYEVVSHKEVLHKVADALYRRHADDFDELLELKGRKHPYVARSPQALMNPKSCYEVASSGYFVDTHLSALDVRRRADLLLRQFGYSPSDLEVLFDYSGRGTSRAPNSMRRSTSAGSMPSSSMQT